MSKSLSLLSDDVGGGGGGGGGGVVRGGVVESAESVGVTMGFWSTELVLPSVVDSFSSKSGLLIIFLLNDPLSLCVLRSDSCVSSEVVCGRGVLLHVSAGASGYFERKVPFERSPSYLRSVDVLQDVDPGMVHCLVGSRV